MIVIYLIVINAIGFLLMLTDKQKAKKGLWRIPEKTLFTVAIIGGSLGCIAGMRTFRHKTKHKTFTLGMPAILVGQIILVSIAIYMYQYAQ